MVVEGLYIGSEIPARRLDVLKEAGITHVVQALPTRPPFPDDFKYKVVAIMDSPTQAIDFDPIVEFIHEALTTKDNNGNGSSKSNNVLVHCQAGVSRSASIVLGYLMYAKQMYVCLLTGILDGTSIALQ